jgi:hypothetical protein
MSQNVPQLVLANSSNAQQTQQVQQQTVPRLITTLQPQQGAGNHVQIRPVLTQGGQLTLIQRPGQQAQLVQAAQIMQPQIQKTIITRPQVVQVSQQNQQVANQQATGTTIKVASTTTNATGQRRGLSLSVMTKQHY